jgi:hypothetical protein
MDRVTLRLWRGVEEPLPSVAEGTSALLNLPMLLGTFRPPTPDKVFPWGRERCKRLLYFEGYAVFAQPSPGKNNSKAGGAQRSSTSLARSIPSSKILHRPGMECTLTIQCVSRQTLLSDIGGRKAQSSTGKLSTAEVLRLRAPSAVSPDPSVRRSAQDDDFVGVWKKKHPNKQHG